jgi:hypothetical protein
MVLIEKFSASASIRFILRQHLLNTARQRLQPMNDIMLNGGIQT